MRNLFSLAATAALCASPALAAQEKPITDSDPDAMDVAKTPVTDLNIDKQDIPELLIAAQRQPYTLRGLPTCGPLIAAVNDLDQLLGPDIDLPQEARDRISAGRVAKTVVGSFIPFRGLIREVSGANDHDRKVRAAIQAGLARRGFLKGVGRSRGCSYPARPASRKDIAAAMMQRAVEDTDQRGKPVQEEQRKNSNPRYSSEPVVQRTK